jgi:tetratricopeptide (TPR) repeat protein
VTDQPGIRRAIQLLGRSLPRIPGDELDWDLTAAHGACNQAWIPVYRPTPDQPWDVFVVADASPTMAVWRDTIDDLLALLSGAGGLRTVALRMLVTDRPAASEAALAFGSTGPVVEVRPGATHPAARRIVLVLTDGCAPGWRSGVAGAALERWARSGPVAVIHLLPQTVWDRTGLRAWPALLRSPGTGVPNRRIDVKIRNRRLRVPGVAVAPERMVPIPVLELNRRWLSSWARLIARPRPGWVPLAVAFVSSSPGTSALIESEDFENMDAGMKVIEFRAAVPPPVFTLARLLAATPLDLPIMRQVQDLFLRRSKVADLAQILAHGLILPVAAPHQTTDPWHVTFEFAPGIREELLAGARRGEILRVAGLASEKIESQLGGGGELRRLLDDPDTVSEISISDETVRWVLAARAVLQALSGRYLPAARRLDELLDEYHATRSTIYGKHPLGQAGRALRSTVGRPAQRGAKHGTAESRVSRVSPGARAAHVSGEAAMAAQVADHVTPDQRPRSTPAIWGNVPPRNPNFTGRNDLLAELHERLRAEQETAVLPHALHGMGGVGKSQLTVEYLYRHLNDYDVVWWIPAERTTQIGSALVDLAQRLDLRAGNEASTAVPAVLEALRRGEPYANWLLVFDNAESPESVRPYFPSGGTGNLLITSRNPQWANTARPLEVNVFLREESKALLRLRGPEISDEDADRLAEELGDLPLAVEQAAAWRAETGMPAEEYLRLLEEKRVDLLELSAPLDYQIPVIAAWNVSLDQLETKNPAALQLLQVCSFCAPEPIARGLFTGVRGRSLSPELDAAVADPIRLGRVIREIGRYSLAKIDHRTNSIQMHRLVQAALVSRMTDEDQDRMRRAAHLLLAANDPDDPHNAHHWGRYAELFPHVIASGAVESDDAWTRGLIVNEVRYLYRWGDYDAGRELAQRAYDTWRERLGKDNAQTLEVARWLGFVLFSMGRYAEAAELNARVLETYQAAFGADHEDTLDALGNVAIDRRVQGDFATALELAKTVHQGSVRALGLDDPDTLRAAHNVGVSLRLTGDFASARDLDQQTWDRKIQIYGQDHPVSLVTWLGLILDIRELGDYLTALTYQRDIYAQCRRLLGDNNPFTLSAFRHMAVSLRKAGEHLEALERSEKARSDLIRRYREDNPESMAATLELTVNLRQARKLTEARDLGIMTYERYCTTLGVTHPHTLSARVNLAITHRLLGDATTGRKIDSDCLDRLRLSVGDDHPVTMVCATNLASDLFALGAIDEAYRLDAQTLGRSRQVLGDAHPSTLACAANVALDLRAIGRVDEAEKLHADTVAKLVRVLGSNHPGAAQATDWERRADCDIDPMPL